MSDWYTDGTLDGRQWTLIRGSHIRTPDGDVPLPLKHGNGAPENALYLRVAKDGSKFACVGNDDDLCWERVDGAWHDRGIAYGPQSVLYDNDGTLHIVPPPEAFGYRYVKPNNQIVTCTDSHENPALKLWDYTKLGDVFIGQGGNGPHGEDPCIAIEADGSRRLILAGRCRFINAYRDGDAFAVYFVREDTAEAKWFLLTRQQIAELPLIEADAPPVKPPPIPLDQVEPLTGKWLVSFYEQNGNCPPDKLPPGNAQVAVRKHAGVVPRPTCITSETEGKVTGEIIGYRVGSEAQSTGEVVTIEIMEERARIIAAMGQRPWFYWDAPIVDKIVQHTIPRWPILPSGSVVELNAFCGRNEKLWDFEREMHRYIGDAASHGYLLCLAVQTHTTNLDLLADPSRAIPPVIRLCQTWRAQIGERFLGINVFNNSGRDDPNTGEGGLTANPQLVPHWTRVFYGYKDDAGNQIGGVTGLPDIFGNGGGGGDDDMDIEIAGTYPRKWSRQEPNGFLHPVNITHSRAIRAIELSMEGSGEAPFRIEFPGEKDGRFFRGIAWKPGINGTWWPLARAFDDQGAMALKRGPHQVEVTADPVDPIEPPDPPSNEWPNLLSDLQAERAKYPAEKLDWNQGVAIVNAVAWKNRTTGAGLMLKTGGNRGSQPHTGIECSVDWMVFKTFSKGLDCLIATGNVEMNELGETTPTWHDGEPWTEFDRWVPPVAP